ncbi:MAG: NAD(P)-dependent oxidoreductase [Candidatus Heimdallarchaeota archaeon]|nr:NAD(P)-dependent oxidoreductase [Candidatus Heimdallarchaeota archaeon]
MKILLTGAFGNVGTSTLKELIKRDHQIRCFDIPSRTNKRKAKKFRKYQSKMEIIWGDLRKIGDVENAVKDVDVIIHLAAIIPPLANNRPEIAEPVNVGGTKNILTAIKKQTKQPKLIFSSSVAIYGDVRAKGFDYIIKTTDQANPSSHDHYARHKIKCEKMIQESDIEYAIFRFAAIPALNQGTDPIMYDVPLDTPIEICHTLDTGYAMVNAVESDRAWGKILHIAGGPECRVSYKEYVGMLLDIMGIGRLPDQAYGNEPFHCGFMDTVESEEILHYQRHTFKDYLEDMKKHYSVARIFARIFRPAIRKWLLNQSPYYKAYTKSIKEYIQNKKRITLKAKKKITPNSSKTTKLSQ